MDDLKLAIFVLGYLAGLATSLLVDLYYESKKHG